MTLKEQDVAVCLCTLCSNGNIEDIHHMILKCEYLRDARGKYIKPSNYK